MGKELLEDKQLPLLSVWMILQQKWDSNLSGYEGRQMTDWNGQTWLPMSVTDLAPGDDVKVLPLNLTEYIN